MEANISGLISIIVLIIFALLVILNSIRVFKEYDRALIFRLGRAIGVKGPGLIILWPIIDRMSKVSLRISTLEVEPQDVITRDNITIKINAVVEIKDYSYAINQLAQTTLRSICGQSDLDKLLTERDKVNSEIQEILDKHTDAWGVKVTLVELKQIDLPQNM